MALSGPARYLSRGDDEQEKGEQEEEQKEEQKEEQEEKQEKDSGG